MTAPAITTDTTTQTAADAAVAASATEAAAKAVADKAAADALAAQWKAPATKEEYDKAITDAVTAAESKYKAPDKYDLKLPDKSTIDPTVVERTAAIARELGLSQDNASKMLGLVASEVATQVAAREEAFAKALQPNSPEWTAAYNTNKAALLADPDIGNGKPEQLEAKLTLLKKVAARFGDEDLNKLLEAGSPDTIDPRFVKMMTNIGAAMSEQALVKPTGTAPEAPKRTADKMYPNGADLVEGDPRLNQPATAT